MIYVTYKDLVAVHGVKEANHTLHVLESVAKITHEVVTPFSPSLRFQRALEAVSNIDHAADA